MKNTLFISISIMLFISASRCSDTSFGNDLWDNVTSSKITSDKQITSFSINGYKARINGTTIKSVLPIGTSATSLAPVITHNGAAISPESETAQDFSNPVTYTVTATDGTTEQYTVSVTVLDAAGMKNANLSVLRVKKGKLQPALNDSIKDYLDAPIPFSDSANPAYNDKQSNSLIADPEILIATMKMELESNGKVSVENATEHVFPEIEVGPNKVTIIVTAADKTTTKKYTVNMYRAIPIFKTGAGEISGYDLNPLEDGATQRGVSWPEKRFSIQSSTITANGEKKEESVVIDNMTGLVWLNQTTQSSTDLSSAYSYQDAVSNAYGIPKFALSPYEWRLPNIREIRSLANYCKDGNNYLNGVFKNYGNNYVYWSSTTYMGSTNKAFPFEIMNNRSILSNVDEDKYLFVVRGNSRVLPATGQKQTDPYILGDDGNLQKGVVWPDPRFYKYNDDANSPIVDNMTSLMWYPSSFFVPAESENFWNSSLTTVDTKNQYGFSDWFIPNVNEIETLTNYSSDSLDWLNSYINLISTPLWTSTSFSEVEAYALNYNAQFISYGYKDSLSYYVLPVRQAKIINY